MTVFWDVASRNLVEIDQRFRGAYCLRHQGDHPDDDDMTLYCIIGDCHLNVRRLENL
jgi:hypothetical protein